MRDPTATRPKRGRSSGTRPETAANGSTRFRRRNSGRTPGSLPRTERRAASGPRRARPIGAGHWLREGARSDPRSPTDRVDPDSQASRRRRARYPSHPPPHDSRRFRRVPWLVQPKTGFGSMRALESAIRATAEPTSAAYTESSIEYTHAKKPPSGIPTGASEQRNLEGGVGVSSGAFPSRRAPGSPGSNGALDGPSTATDRADPE